MTTQRAASPWWEPTWRRVVGSTVVLFVVILAFLVGRVRAGADPGLARTTTPVPQSAPPAASGQPTPGVDPNVDPNIDPNGSAGTDDNFGNAVPDGSNTQDVDPPSTHVS